MSISYFTAAGYTFFCSGADGSTYKRKGAHGVGLSVSGFSVAGVDKGGLFVECISVCQMDKGSHSTPGQIKWCVIYRRICLRRRCTNPRERLLLEGTPQCDQDAIDEVLREDHLLVLVDAKARTGKRENGCADSPVLGAYGRDELSDYREKTTPPYDKQACAPQYVFRLAQPWSIVHVSIRKRGAGQVPARLYPYTTC